MHVASLLRVQVIGKNRYSKVMVCGVLIFLLWPFHLTLTEKIYILYKQNTVLKVLPYIGVYKGNLIWSVWSIQDLGKCEFRTIVRILMLPVTVWETISYCQKLNYLQLQSMKDSIICN